MLSPQPFAKKSVYLLKVIKAQRITPLFSHAKAQIEDAGMSAENT
jgi:hypothetical protein